MKEETKETKTPMPKANNIDEVLKKIAYDKTIVSRKINIFSKSNRNRSQGSK